jgi:EAL domain-containing protein (putative c-di-GMP-specific phosphodiesterase class I)
VGYGTVVGFEALLRWNHPERGLLAPGSFLARAEEAGTIEPMGAWVLGRACEEAERLTSQAGRPVQMSVNVSRRQLYDPELVRDVAEALERSGLDPDLLTLDITEAAIVEADAVARLRQLKTLGVRLALDDFSGGYSSLARLRGLPVDRLKIDLCLGAGLSGRSAGQATDAGLVAMGVSLSVAHLLGLEAVAEGVETVEQLEALAGLGCDLAQGYTWARPEPAGRLARWLETRHEALDHPVRVLVADDRDEVRLGISLTLNLDGLFEVVAEAADGDEAVEAARRFQPELVLLDVIMPGRGGLAALSDIQAAAPSAKVVLLTAMDPADLPADARKATAAQLDKALDFDELARRLLEVTAV